jgi:hypothetical protein
MRRFVGIINAPAVISGCSAGKQVIYIAFAGARFESARQVAQGPDLPAAITDLLQPAPIGVLQAKAAGVQLKVRRDGVQSTTQQARNHQTTGETK